MKIFRIIGNEGRITIPYSIRQAVGFLPDDVVSFQLMEDDSVLVRREALRRRRFRLAPGGTLPLSPSWKAWMKSSGTALWYISIQGLKS